MNANADPRRSLKWEKAFFIVKYLHFLTNFLVIEMFFGEKKKIFGGKLYEPPINSLACMREEPYHAKRLKRAHRCRRSFQVLGLLRRSHASSGRLPGER